MLKLFKQYYPIRNIFFFVGESIFIVLSILLATWVISGFSFALFSETYLPKVMLVGFVIQACLYYNDLYEFKVSKTFRELGLRLLEALGAAAILLALVFFFFPEVGMADGVLEASAVVMLGVVISWRYVYTLTLERGIFNQRIIVMGSGELAQSIVKEIQEKKDCGYSISLIMYEEGDQNVWVDFKTLAPIKVAGNALNEKAMDAGAKKVIVALGEKRGRLPIRELLQCRLDGVEVIDGNSFIEMLTGKLIVRNLNPGWLIFSEGFHKSPVKRVLKRSADIFLSLVLLVLLSPLMTVVAVLIKLDSQGPVIFSQQRAGKGRHKFQIYKFRSMVQDAEKTTGPVWAGEDDPRITRIGKIIRRLRIDELPQIWNVLKGDMSFVGPRPEREVFIKELIKQIPYYDARLTVKPGVTGWAQINYSYGASVEDAVEKLNYDLFYIKNMSFFMDILIILRTVKIVLFGRGAR
jgi:sugar transferase (PEP-CTERM system associated)